MMMYEAWESLSEPLDEPITPTTAIANATTAIVEVAPTTPTSDMTTAAPTQNWTPEDLGWTYTSDDNWGSWTNNYTSATNGGYATPDTTAPVWDSWQDVLDFSPSFSKLGGLPDSVKQAIVDDPYSFLHGLSQNNYRTGGDIPTGYESVPMIFDQETMSYSPEYWANAKFVPGEGLVAPTGGRTFTEDTSDQKLYAAVAAAATLYVGAGIAGMGEVAAGAASGGEFLGAGVDPVVAADATAGTSMFGATEAAAPFMGAGVDPVVGADASAGTPMFGGEAPFMGAGVDPVTAADAAQGTQLVSTGTAPVGLVDKAIEWAGKQVGTELIKSAITPEAPTLPDVAAAPAKTPFGFFGGLPWKPGAASGASGLTRLSTGKSVFGAGALASPGGIVSNWMGRG